MPLSPPSIAVPFADPATSGLQGRELTLAETIARDLRRRILLGEMKPGARIKERDGAEWLGVSRTPMREAIRILAQEGLVVLHPSRSPVIADPDLKQVSDDLQVMVTLEILAGELACKHASADELAALRVLHQRLTDSYDQILPVDLFEIDMAFHHAITDASHNLSLAATHGAYVARLWRVRFLAASRRRNRMRLVAQHGAILAGLEARDPDQTAAAIRGHLQDFSESIRASFEDGSLEKGPD